jgi:menaquinone-dependent protoporphyrinogen oxidase
MARFLLLFASSHGHTRDIAWAIERELRRRGHAVDLVDSRLAAPSADEYDMVVLGSRVQFGKHARPIRRYIRRHADELARVRSAFFSVSMSAAGPEPSRYADELMKETGWHPQRWTSFAGGLEYRQYNPLLRFVMKRIARKAGHSTDTSRDHDYTDWGAVRRFARALADDAAELTGAQEVRPVTVPVQAVREAVSPAPAAPPARDVL